MATYVNDLRLKEIATGDESGTWGTSTNTNLELIAEAFSYATDASFASDANATTTIADGGTDPFRSIYIKVTSGASLSATRQLTIAPDTVSKIFIIENATSGSQSISIKQGSGAGAAVTIPNGDVKVVATDGGGSGAIVYDLFTDLNLAGTTSVAALTSAGRVLVDDTTEATSTTDGSLQTDGGLSVAKDVVVGDDVKLLSDSAVLSLGADSDATVTHDGTTGVTIAANPITLDSGGDITFDAAGNDFSFQAGGTEVLKITNSSSDVIIKPIADDKDLIFQQRDGTEVARVEDNGTFNIVTDKLAINGTAVTATAAELNFIDGGATVGTTAVADGDGIIHNDDGTMKVTSAATFKTYFQSGLSSGLSAQQTLVFSLAA